MMHLRLELNTAGHNNYSVQHASFYLTKLTINQGFFCVGTRGYGVPGNENDESIVCMSVLY